MFENLRAAFREAVENFKEELARDEVPEAVDRLLHGMREEAADARAHIKALEEDVRRTRVEAEREQGEVRTCERRERLARQIGDEDTARVAGEFGEKHRERARVLEEKAAALEKELRLRSREYDEMVEQVKEARKRRDILAAQVGRGSARESIRQGEDLFDELDRMADRMGGFDGEEDAGFDSGSDAPPRPPDVDQRLAELKKRMGQDPSG